MIAELVNLNVDKDSLPKSLIESDKEIQIS